MCGITGVMSRYLSEPEIECFEDLMKVSALRGMDGAGVVAVAAKKSKTHVIRTKLSSFDLVQTEEFANLCKEKRSIFLGHARLPTKGSAEDYNMIHPHRVDHIIGVHNGTLSEVDGKWVDKEASDSKLMFESIARHGIDHAIAESRGAYCLVWIDELAHTINFLRNYERPLSFGYYVPLIPSKDDPKKLEPDNNARPGTLYFASEPDFLRVVLRRRGGPKHSLKVFPLPVDTLMSFSLKIGGDVVPREERKLERPIKPWTPYQQNQNQNQSTHHEGSRRWYHGAQNHGGQSNNSGQTLLPPPRNNSDSAPVSRNGVGAMYDVPDTRKQGSLLEAVFRNAQGLGGKVETYETQRNFFVTWDKLNEVLNSGCSFCGHIAAYSDYTARNLKFIGKNDYLCIACSTDPNLPPVAH